MENKQAVPIYMPEIIKPMEKLKVISEANGMTLLTDISGKVFRVNPRSQILEPLGFVDVDTLKIAH